MRRTKLHIAGLAALVALVSLVLPQTASANRRWAAGKWRLVQNYSEHHEEKTFQGRLRITRDGDRFHGRIYFDVVGDWEPLEDVVVGDETIRFTRPRHNQEFHGVVHGDVLEGSWRFTDREREWTWRAEKD